jgi:hypothetical protein
MTCTRQKWWMAALVIAASAATGATAQKSDKESKGADRPRVVLKAQTNVGVSPARVVFTAELVGGPDDFEEFYCASVEWDWGDDTKSESTADCEPYEAGRSAIKRRFTVAHVFNRAGAYKVYFKLKRRDKIAAAAATNVQIRPGPTDFD